LRKNHLLISFLIIIFILGITGCSKKQVDEYSLTFRLKPDMQVNYSIEINNTLVKSGTLNPEWTDIKVNHDGGQYIIYFWRSDYYVDSIREYHYSYPSNATITKELKLNKENKKGILNVSLLEKVNADEDKINYLLFKAVNGTVKKISYCTKKSVGFIYANQINDISLCYNNYWTNVTPFGNLTGNDYYCDYVVTKCKITQYQKCNNDIFIMPGISVDNCYFTGKTLKESDEIFSIPLKIKTMGYYDNLDKLDIYLIDMDLTPNKRILGKEWGFNFKKAIKIGEVK